MLMNSIHFQKVAPLPLKHFVFEAHVLKALFLLFWCCECSASWVQGVQLPVCKIRSTAANCLTKV